MSFRTVLMGALIAGIVAGLCVATFHFIFTEPLIEQAIQIEEQMAHQQGAAEHAMPVVSRTGQKVGLFVGYLIYGLSWALLFSVAYHMLQGRLSALGRWRGALALAFLVYWSVVLIPFLKYPANPPGVGDPATVGYRQKLYFGILLLAIGATASAVYLGRAVAQRLGARQSWPATLVLLILSAAVLLQVMPNNPDPVLMPADLVFNLRTLSLAGLTLFWAVFGLSFGWLAHRADHPQAKAAWKMRKAT
jgi:predicted cobalt transporter CbtA